MNVEEHTDRNVMIRISIRDCCSNYLLLREMSLLSSWLQIGSKQVRASNILPNAVKSFRILSIGEKVKTLQKMKTSFLSSVPDWQMLVDIDRQLKFKVKITPTKLRPEMIN